MRERPRSIPRVCALRFFRGIAPLFAAAVCLLSAACGPRERPVDVAAREGILLVGNGGASPPRWIGSS